MKGAAVGESRTTWRAEAAARFTLAQARRLARLGHQLRRSTQAALVALADQWRRSLQLRVITATLVVSGLVVAVLGVVLMQEIAQNVIGSKEKAADNIASVGLNLAKNTIGVTSTPTAAAPQLMYSIVQKLQATGSSGPGNNYAVMVRLPAAYQGSPVYSGGQNAGFSMGVPRPPAHLVKLVVHNPGKLFVVPATMSVVGDPHAAGLAYGGSFGSVYQLYYFFPMAADQTTLTHAQHTLLLVGVAVVFLLAAIAWLVTRWVVIPVRLAAHGALRLSTGNLGERMQVRGSDDLAALATAFNQMAASLQEKLGELEDLSRVQRQFVSDVSHELRTPLTTIRIAADVLFGARDEFGPASARSAELLQSQLERFESLLTDLLEISRYDANAATLDAEPVDVCDIARQSADVAQQLAERRGTRIEFRLPTEPCIAEVDSRRVERILRNLLVNAVEHGENREAVVTVAADSGAVAVSVRDFGVGLAPGEEQLVFDRFWRADPARARTTGGTGLGLAIAQEDARLHGGWLEAWGEPGRGSVFRLTLPRMVGGTLAGSPLPLGPGPGDVDAEVAGLTATVIPLADASPASGPASARASGRDSAQHNGQHNGRADPAEPGTDSEVTARG